MTLNLKLLLLLVACTLLSSCHLFQEPSNGKIFTALGQDDAFAIATGNEDEIVIDILEAYNKMDAEAIWKHAQDSVYFQYYTGETDTLTLAGMNRYFASVDSVQWMVGAVIPIKIIGGERVSVLTDGTSTIFHKDGTKERFKLFERFIFQDEKLVGVTQWRAEVN
jgi:hypothetical protein